MVNGKVEFHTPETIDWSSVWRFGFDPVSAGDLVQM